MVRIELTDSIFKLISHSCISLYAADSLHRNLVQARWQSAVEIG